MHLIEQGCIAYRRVQAHALFEDVLHAIVSHLGLSTVWSVPCTVAALQPFAALLQIILASTRVVRWRLWSSSGQPLPPGHAVTLNNLLPVWLSPVAA